MSTSTISSNWFTLGQYPLEPKTLTDIILEKKEPSDGGLTIYKGTTIMPISLSRIAFTLEDIETRKKWVARLSEHSLIEKSRDGMEYTTYEHYDMLWPVSDRDYVVHQQWKILDDSPMPAISLECHSIENGIFPIQTDRVRGDLQHLQYTLEFAGQNKTNISVEIQVDPKGNLPSFFANIIQKNWPINTLKAIYKEAKKTGAEHQMIKSLLKI